MLFKATAPGNHQIAIKTEFSLILMTSGYKRYRYHGWKIK